MAKNETALKKENKAGKSQTVTSTILIAAVAVALLVLGIGFFVGQAGPAPAPAPVVSDPLDTDAGRILLKWYDSGAAMEQYFLNYTIDDNGAAASYVLASDGKRYYARVDETFDVMRVYVDYTNNSTDTVCLKYGAVEKCARAGNDESARGLVSNLKTLAPTKTTYLALKAQTKKLINVGAVKLSPNVGKETVNGFETSKISYILDYRNLTVDKLQSVGISPNDQTLYTVAEVTYWIDTDTGMIVKSHAAISSKNGKSYYDQEYSGMEFSNVNVPEAPAQTFDVKNFLAFYKQSADDYSSKEKCNAMRGSERDTCYKSLAAEKKNWELCLQVSDKLEYERCTIFVAQATNNHVLCEKLANLADECRIAVVSRTGNAEICKLLLNRSMADSCANAAAAGQKLMDERQAAIEKAVYRQNCNVDSNCKIYGNYGQMCAPANLTAGQITTDGPWLPIYPCYANVSCGCNSGVCGFLKTETYYKCISDTENYLLQLYINNLASQNDNSTGGTAGNSTKK